MKPDIVMQYCVYCDYPLYRLWLTKYRSRFGKVIIYPSRHHGVIDLEDFAKSVVHETWVERLNIDYGVTDWRQGEVEPCLEKITSDWVWFSEQDFFCKDWGRLFQDVEKASKTSDAIGLWNPTHFPYLHPSCLIVKKETFDKTNKDFRAHSEINGADHFSMITRDLETTGAKITTFQDLGYDCEVTPDADCFHLGGLTYVYQDWKGKDTHFGVKSPEAFYAYNEKCREASVEQNLQFFSLSMQVKEELEKRYEGIAESSKKWDKFFTI